MIEVTDRQTDTRDTGLAGMHQWSLDSCQQTLEFDSRGKIDSKIVLFLLCASIST